MTGPSAEPRPGASRDPGDVRRRGWLEVRWRQFRRAPRPVVRAVASSLTVALVLGIVYLAYDVAVGRGAALPGGDLRLLALAGYVAAVLIVVTLLVVPLPTGGARRTARTPWSAALGLFAAVPIAYLVLVVLVELVKPLLG
jgi:DMSO/TMAO reductase YedYZ heme-binding membrane subunit